MKKITSILSLSAFTFLSAMPTAQGQSFSDRSATSSLNSDPEVLSLENYSKPIQLLLVGDTALYASKAGNKSRKLATLNAGSKVQLIAITPNAYRISGQGRYGKVKGWVSPRSLASTDPKFVENLKNLYDRQIRVNRLIANNEVAIGMTISEVNQALGEPTKKEVSVTKEGTSGSYQFIEQDEQKHYRYISDAFTGQVFKQFSHVTTVEKSNITVDFVNNVVTGIVSKDDSSEPNVTTVIPPVYFNY